MNLLDKLWLNVLNPKMLYGQEIIVYDKRWIEQMESVQHKIGCIILGVHNQVSRVGVRAELGWGSIQRDIYTNRLRKFGQIARTDESRWTKKILMQLILEGIRTPWLKQVGEALEALQLNEEVFEQKNWKTIIKQEGMRWEDRNFRDYRTKYNITVVSQK